VAKTEFSFIFWDNDGVLVDTEGLYYQANREALAQLGVDLGHDAFGRISLTEGRTVFDLAIEQGHAAVVIEQQRRWRDLRYTELLAQGDLVLPGVFETLLRLHRKIDMAIVTSSRQDHFDAIHRRFNLLQFFEFVLTREDYQMTKPDPEPYLLALANSRRSSQDCLVIEDSPRGVAAAKAAGLTCWAMPSAQTRGMGFPDADLVLEDVREIVDRLGL